MSIFGDLFSGIFGSQGSQSEPAMSEAGRYLLDQTKNLYNTASTTPTTKVSFGGNTFEIMPKAVKDRISMELAVLKALNGLQMNQSQTGATSGLLGKLALPLGLAAGTGKFDNLFSSLFGGSSGTTGLSSDAGSYLNDMFGGDNSTLSTDAPLIWT